MTKSRKNIDIFLAAAAVYLSRYDAEKSSFYFYGIRLQNRFQRDGLSYRSER